MDCIFCKIVNGLIPCYKIYEDELVLAFLDINPDCMGHTLIIPKKHYQDLSTIDNVELMHILELAKSLMKDYSKKLNCDGFTFVQNNGDVQEVKHFHLHLKPYYKNNIDRKPEEVLEILTK